MHNFRFIFLFWVSTEIVLKNLQSQKLLVFHVVGLYAVLLFTLCLKLFVLAPVSLRPPEPQAHSVLIGQFVEACQWAGENLGFV